ncbi:hypothetical protein L1987_86060 [Smallanthus sonchifolius]|uniref:Uncharacterized protein n=1 Tax=Smallanthus sonchifolius TaxID=185202 RepID=A0ACB8XYX0_9ASTR|nr:hypothetical protein L1987_86060 [Smallanthus sonchifolius]
MHAGPHIIDNGAAQYTGPIIDNGTALENIYRLNKGGGRIAADNDTGMYRSWDEDENYLHGNSTGLAPVYDKPIMYTKEVPNYTAPELVYQTQRSMGKQSDKQTAEDEAIYSPGLIVVVIMYSRITLCLSMTQMVAEVNKICG